MKDVTRFGTTWLPLSRAVSALRARAAASGTPLVATSEVDTAAAVVAADAWLYVHHTDRFDRSVRFGAPAVRSLAALLARAAGAAVSHEPPPWPAGPGSVEVCALVESYRRWAQEVTSDGVGVLRRAAADLGAAGQDAPLGDFAAVLVTASDVAELDWND